MKKFGDSEPSDPSPPDSRKRSLAEAETEADVPQVSEERRDILTKLDAAIAAETELGSKISKVKKAISTLNTKMKAVCIRERNQYTQRHLELDFKTGQGEFLEELEAGGNNVSYPEFQGVYDFRQCLDSRLTFLRKCQEELEHILCFSEGLSETSRPLSA